MPRGEIYFGQKPPSGLGGNEEADNSLAPRKVFLITQR